MLSASLLIFWQRVELLLNAFIYSRFLATRPRQPEVTYTRQAILIDQYVGRLQVPVHYVGRVQEV